MRILEIIKSRDNKFLKHCRKLNIKKYREEEQCFVAEGVRMLEEAVKSRARIKYCLCMKDLQGDRVHKLIKDLSNRNVDIYYVEDDLLAEVCDTSTPQGIAAVIENEAYSPDRVFKGSDFIVLLDRIQDPGNLGTIIRTADAAGAGGVVITEGTVDPYNSKVLRSTMGSIFHIPVVYISDIKDAFTRLKDRDYTIYGAVLKGSRPYYDETYKDKKVAVVIGNEANGIDEGVIRYLDRLIKIPMPGKAESLNASVAAGILMFEVAKQRANIDN